MALPTPTDYYTAVQIPQVCFTDIELMSSTVELTAIGLPKPYSGNFTTTYKLTNGANDWAVRCFTREINDLKQRYQAIGDFLSKNQSNYFVEAKYLPNGIKIGHKSYPMIKMKWINGDVLNVYISRNHSNRSVIESLLNDFVNLVKDLETFNIAHGDLQHGNILVQNGRVFLIDYDGMFFPELTGLGTNEIGHPNYQHPERSSSHFNKDMDRFASIVIYLGLKAVAINPALWRKYSNDDNILFKQSDLRNPQTSELIRDLYAIPTLRDLVNRLITICRSDYDSIPSLESFISDGSSRSLRSQPRVIDGTEKATIMSYLGEHIEVVGQLTSVRQRISASGTSVKMSMGPTPPNQTFNVFVQAENYASLKTSDHAAYKKRWVSVVGVVSRPNGLPQIEIEKATQIRILSEDEARRLLGNSPPQILEPNWDILNDIYTPKISTPRVMPEEPAVPKPPEVKHPPQQKPEDWTTNDTRGCLGIIIGAIIGGAIGANISDGDAGWIVGAIVVGFLGLIVTLD
jgi:hypothetical protein